MLYGVFTIVRRTHAIQSWILGVSILRISASVFTVVLTVIFLNRMHSSTVMSAASICLPYRLTWLPHNFLVVSRIMRFPVKCTLEFNLTFNVLSLLNSSEALSSLAKEVSVFSEHVSFAHHQNEPSEHTVAPLPMVCTHGDVSSYTNSFATYF